MRVSILFARIRSVWSARPAGRRLVYRAVDNLATVVNRLVQNQKLSGQLLE
jgi:hypothetical protein